MQPGQGLSNHDVPLITCQKEPLWLILNDKQKGHLFSQPAVEALTEDEKAIYLAEIERPMDAGTLMNMVKEKFNIPEHVRLLSLTSKNIMHGNFLLQLVK